MPIQQITDNEFFDMFNLPTDKVVEDTSFKNSTIDTNIFSEPIKTEEEKKVEPVIEEIENIETDIFATEAKEEAEAEDPKKPGKKPKYDFSDASGYFEDRVKQGKFVAVDEDVNGEKKPFIPKTPEEFDEFFDINLNYKLEEKQKELEKSWYDSKSPAWKYVAQYAEKVDHPSKLVDFIQGVQNIDDISGVDEKTPEGAEQIYRTWLTKRGEPAAIIEKQIEIAKNSDQLIAFGENYKPILLQDEQRRLAEMDAKDTQQQQMYLQIITENRNKAIEAIEAPIFGKQKLKEDEKALVYDLIANPSQEAGGYGIYAAIDKLYETKDFSTLRELALHIGKKDSFFTYAGNKKADEVATNLQRTLSVATKKTATSEDEDVSPQKTASVSRQQYANNTNAFSRR